MSIYKFFKTFSFFAFYLSLINFNACIAMEDKEDDRIPRVKVTIVGGGLAGLTAARALEGRENYALFEAKPTLGGRTYSENIEGAAFNMGGEWIDPEHTSMQKLAEEVGVPLQKETYTSPIRMRLEGKDFSPEGNIALLESILSKITPVIKAFESKCFYSQSNLEQILPEALTPAEKSFIHTYLRADEGLSPSMLDASAIYGLRNDLKELKTLLGYKESFLLPVRLRNLIAYQYRVVSGMTRMIDAIKDRLDPKKIYPKYELKRISKGVDGEFHLSFNHEGEPHKVIAKAVIMTIPFSVLRFLDLDESLGLSELQKRAIQTLPYGSNAKVQVRGVTRPNFRYYLHGETQTTSWLPVSGPGFTIYTGGEKGLTLSEETAAPLVSSVLRDLGLPEVMSATGGSSSSSFSSASAAAASPPFIVKNWSQDPFAKGSYSANGICDFGLRMPSNLSGFKEFREFAEPVGGFIFAGEHTQLDCGYMESAVRSGETAAQYYLHKLSAQSPEVHPTK